MTNGGTSLASVAEVQNWVDDVRSADRTQVASVSLAASQAWRLSEGRIRHDTGRYFDIVGLEWTQNGVSHCQPFIEQREIGTLGFIARRSGDSLDLLVQAKAEPGNVGIVQLAPTCQATSSNNDRVHGGRRPPFAGYFERNTSGIQCDSLQSEHGGRFLGKLNRNILVVDNNVGIDAEDDLTHRWISLDLLKTLLEIDFLVNTDARSVLCCMDWRMWSAGSRDRGNEFGQALRDSLHAEVRSGILQDALMRVDRLKQAMPAVRHRAIESLDGWVFTPNDAMTMTNGRLALRHIEVHCATRETPHWDQPILRVLEEAIVELLCRNRDGLLEFAFCPRWEPGLVRGVELGPTFFSGPAETGTPGTVRARVRQSDEGSRFDRTVADYRIVEIETIADEDRFTWLRLSEVQTAMSTGIFNNEARSALSLVLPYL